MTFSVHTFYVERGHVFRMNILFWWLEIKQCSTYKWIHDGMLEIDYEEVYMVDKGILCLNMKPLSPNRYSWKLLLYALNLFVHSICCQLVIFVLSMTFILGSRGYTGEHLRQLWHASKIHLWRHSIVLALHYFQGMACYRSATLLEVMDTRSSYFCFI